MFELIHFNVLMIYFFALTEEEEEEEVQVVGAQVAQIDREIHLLVAVQEVEVEHVEVEELQEVKIKAEAEVIKHSQHGHWMPVKMCNIHNIH